MVQDCTKPSTMAWSVVNEELAEDREQRQGSAWPFGANGNLGMNAPCTLELGMTCLSAPSRNPTSCVSSWRTRDR